MSWVAGNRQADSHLGQAAYVSFNAEGGEALGKAHTLFKLLVSDLEVPGGFH
jgi:hypothetical protein